MSNKITLTDEHEASLAAIVSDCKMRGWEKTASQLAHVVEYVKQQRATPTSMDLAVMAEACGVLNKTHPSLAVSLAKVYRDLGGSPVGLPNGELAPEPAKPRHPLKSDHLNTLRVAERRLRTFGQSILADDVLGVRRELIGSDIAPEPTEPMPPVPRHPLSPAQMGTLAGACKDLRRLGVTDRARDVQRVIDTLNGSVLPPAEVEADDPRVPTPVALEVTATDLLREAEGILRERAKQHDPEGKAERSMPRIVEVFSALTGVKLTESQGWLFMLALKLIRDQANGHPDNHVDAINYVALHGESRRRELKA